MREKISEKQIRNDKVKKLKEKISIEISHELNQLKCEMRDTISNDRCFDYYVKRSFALLRLKEYIEFEYAFMDVEAEYYDLGYIIYLVSDKNLDIWLQDDYSFTRQFLWKAEEIEYDIFPMLNDRYFGFQFTNIIDIVLYDKKMETNLSAEP